MSSKPKDYSWMTKDKLMTYTFVALLVIAAITSIMWFGVYAKDQDVHTLYILNMSIGGEYYLLDSRTYLLLLWVHHTSYM